MLSELKKYRSTANKLLAKYDSTKQRAVDEHKVLLAAEEHLVHAVEAQQVVQGLAKDVQERAHKSLSKVVTHCLVSVFDEPYEFQIIFERKRNATEARLVFVRDGNERDPLTETGGGAVDIAAFALRLSSLLLSRPKARRLVVLDEPFKFVSADLRPAVRQLLKQLAEDMDVQFIMVTHIPQLQTGKVIEL